MATAKKWFGFRRLLLSSLEREALHAHEVMGKQSVRLRFDPAGYICIGWAAVGRVVLESTVLGRVMGGGNDDAVGQTGRSSPIVPQDGVRDDRCRCVPALLIDHHLHAVRRQYFEGAGQCRLRQRMRINAQEKWSVDLLLLSRQADGLAHGQDVGLVERMLEGGPPMARGPKRYMVLGHRWIRAVCVVGRHQPWDVDQQRLLGGLSGPWACAHDALLLMIEVRRGRPIAGVHREFGRLTSPPTIPDAADATWLGQCSCSLCRRDHTAIDLHSDAALKQVNRENQQPLRGFALYEDAFYPS
jgi:hypothetical protein